MKRASRCFYPCLSWEVLSFVSLLGLCHHLHSQLFLLVLNIYNRFYNILCHLLKPAMQQINATDSSQKCYVGSIGKIEEVFPRFFPCTCPYSPALYSIPNVMGESRLLIRRIAAGA